MKKGLSVLGAEDDLTVGLVFLGVQESLLTGFAERAAESVYCGDVGIAVEVLIAPAIVERELVFSRMRYVKSDSNG